MKSLLIPKRKFTKQVILVYDLPGSHLAMDGDTVNVEILDSTRTEATNRLAPESETPKLDAVAQEFVTNNQNWVATDIHEAGTELLNRNGIRTTDEFKGFGNPAEGEKNKFLLASDVMVRFYMIAGSKEGAEEGKGLSDMTTEGFKDNFEKAFLEATSERRNSFERVEESWDSTN